MKCRAIPLLPNLVVQANLFFCLAVGAEEPAVQLALPEDGAVFRAGESIFMQAQTQQTVQKVEFVSGSVIGEASAAPYSFTWQNAPAGIYSISARATTATGQIESWKSTVAVLPPVDEEHVLYVDTNNSSGTSDGSPANPYRRIQEAVAAARSGDTIKVAAGEYSGALAIQEKNLRLVGGYTGGSSLLYSQGGRGDFASRKPRATRLSGEGADPVVDFDFNGNTQWGILDGFTISGGRKGVRAHTFENASGKYFVLINNTVTGNSNPEGGVAGVSTEKVSTAVLTNTISGNTALGYAGLYVDGNATTAGLIKGNLVENNISTEDYSHAAGIAFRGTGATGTVTRNVVRLNRAFYGAGIFVDGDNGSNFARLSFNTVMGNQGIYGTGEFVDGGATAIVEHEVVARNGTLNGEFGGAFGVDSGPATRVIMRNCTVAYNASYYDEYSGGNGLIISEDPGGDAVTVEVKNSIFWHNAALPGGKEINAPGAGLLKIEYSDIQQTLLATDHLQLGGGILQTDPLFADPENDDFHLQSKAGRWNRGSWVSDGADSPALDAGDPRSEFQNEPEPNGGRINMGAWGNTPEASRSGAGAITGFNFTAIRLIAGGVPEISGNGPPGLYELQTLSSFGSGKAIWTDIAVLTNTIGTLIHRDLTVLSSNRFYRALRIQ